jgi:biotin carboxylase
MPKRRVPVVGTTNDYIELLSDRFGGRVMFVTDRAEYNRRSGFTVDSVDEVICDLFDYSAAYSALSSHIDQFAQEITGVTCFDCESMLLASFLAEKLGLSYPSSSVITNCRSKFISKRIWRQHDVMCPEFALVRKASDVIEFQERLGAPVIVKPLTGSGSEFVSLCESRIDCLRACFHIQKGLAAPMNQRMYLPLAMAEQNYDPRRVYMAEEYIGGREFSCDFMLDGDRFEIIRIARKFPVPGLPAGTIMAYFLPACLPGGMGHDNLKYQLTRACHTLGLTRCMGMVDFMIRHGIVYLLELTPRPGGDCLPELILASSGFDILGAALDFAEGKPVVVPSEELWTPLVAMRLPADDEGVINVIDDSEITKDSRVISSILKRQAGDRIVLPPDNYELWNLGTVIFRPNSLHRIGVECQEIRDKLRIEIRTPSWATNSIH